MQSRVPVVDAVDIVILAYFETIGAKTHVLDPAAPVVVVVAPLTSSQFVLSLLTWSLNAGWLPVTDAHTH